MAMPVRIIPQTTVDYEEEYSSTEDGYDPDINGYVYTPMRRVKKLVDNPTRVKLQVIPPCDIRMLQLQSTETSDTFKKKYKLSTNQYRSISIKGDTAAGYVIIDHWEINPMIDGFVKAQLDIDITGIYAMIDRLAEACDNWIMPLLIQWHINATTLDMHAPARPRKSTKNHTTMFD